MKKEKKMIVRECDSLKFCFKKKRMLIVGMIIRFKKKELCERVFNL